MFEQLFYVKNAARPRIAVSVHHPQPAPYETVVLVAQQRIFALDCDEAALLASDSNGGKYIKLVLLKENHWRPHWVRLV